ELDIGPNQVVQESSSRDGGWRALPDGLPAVEHEHDRHAAQHRGVLDFGYLRSLLPDRQDGEPAVPVPGDRGEDRTREAHELMHGRRRSQALVEFALALPMFTLFLLSIFQIGLLFVQYYSEAELTLRMSRWLAIHSSETTDAQFATVVQE